MTTRGDELMNPNQQFPQLLRMKFEYRTLRHLIRLPEDEIAVDVPLLEETVEMSGENSQGWITEEAFFTFSPGAPQVRQRKEVKMNQLSPAERHEFLKSMEVEWQTLLQNQAAKVLSLEETAQAQARWPDRAMDTRWARTRKPDVSKPSGRRAKARLIIKGFTDPDFIDIESHSPTLSLEGFLTVLQSACSHGHKLQFGDVQQAFTTWRPDQAKRTTLRPNAA